MAALPLISRIAVSFFVTCLVVGCEQGPAPTTNATTTTATTTTSTTTKKRGARVTSMFSGLPSRESVGNEPLELKKAKMMVRLPVSWRRQFVGDELWLRPGRKDEKDSAIIAFVSGLDGIKVEDIEKVADKGMKLEDVGWGDKVKAQIGSRRMSAFGSEGRAKLDGEEMLAFYFALETPNGSQLLVVAAVRRDNEAQLDVVIECLRTLIPKP